MAGHSAKVKDPSILERHLLRPIMIFIFAIALIDIAAPPLQAQNEIHLLGSDSTLKCRKIKLHKGYISFTMSDTNKEVRYLRFLEIDYVDIKGKLYGASERGFFKISPELFANDTSRLGALDACRNYSKYKGAATGTFLTTFLAGGILGLIPAISTSATTPREKNLGMPPSGLKSDTIYVKSYIRQAKNMKSGRVWHNYGTGILAIVITVVTVNIIVGAISTTQ